MTWGGRWLAVWLLLAPAGLGEARAQGQVAGAPVAATRVVVLTGDRVTITDIVDIAEGRASIAVSTDGMERIRSARGVIDHYIDQGLPAYGITTM